MSCCTNSSSDLILYSGPTLFCLGIETNDNLSIALQKIDSIVCSTSGIVQNNFVRQLLIDVNDLPDSYTVDNIITYILALPEEERTILETDSKWNVIPIFPNEGDPLILEVYELQNIGKGVITTLERSNLLSITRLKPTWENVLSENPNLVSSWNSIVEQSWTVGSEIGIGVFNGFSIKKESLGSPTVPVYQEGAGIGNEDTQRSLSYYSNRTEFEDGLNSKGIEYAGNYEANFTARSLITRQFLENRIVTNSTTTALSAATLNSTYPGATIGFKVHALSISGGGLIYEKTSTGWCQHSATVVV